MEVQQHLNEDEKSQLAQLQQEYRKCSRGYLDATQNLYDPNSRLSKEELRSETEAARERFERAEKAYRSYVFEMMKKYSLVWL